MWSGRSSTGWRDVVLHVTCAHSHALADGTLAFLLEQPQNF